ncbi:MAG TPA: ankyrin repeat domain-containing protein [Burkholderiales bacterium]|nr:ankyrin repeat domain-containing protein [Burkholderiales bacterium]
MVLITATLFFTTPVFAATVDPVLFGVTVETGDLRSAKRWLDEGLPPDFMADRIGSGLMIGAWEGNLTVMTLFHSRGANVNAVNPQGEQALMHAAWRGHLDAVRWLLEHGAQINRPDRQWTALHYAVFAGHETIARLLIEKGADVNARSTNGSSVLMMAAREGHESLAQRLLTAGADTTAANENGDTALKWSVRYGNLRIARTLSTAEQLAAASREAAHLRPPQRSQVAPKKLNTLLDDIRAARAAGRPLDEVFQAYDAALAELEKQSVPPPRTIRGMVIRAKRNAPGQERATVIYDDSPMSRMVEQIRAARASGKSVDAVIDANQEALTRYQRSGSDAP